jgi:hypothetical protein
MSSRLWSRPSIVVVVGFFLGWRGRGAVVSEFQVKKRKREKGREEEVERERERRERGRKEKSLEWDFVFLFRKRSAWATTGSRHHAKSLSHPRASLPCHIPTFTMGSRLIGISRLYTLKRKKKGRRRANCGGVKRGLRAAAR